MKTTKIVRSVTLLALLLLLSFGVDAHAQSSVDLAVHYVEGTPSEEGTSYFVTVYLSVVDGLGFPIRDLKSDVFWVTEDSQDVSIQNLKMEESEPSNLVLSVDISEGMTGISNVAIKSALKTFLSMLKSNDQVAILTFDDKIESQTGFSIDRIESAGFIDLIPAHSNRGTCIFDAAYSAVQMVSTLPSGNRAVILITDGIDQTTTGAICSIHTVDDVINLASAGGTRTPIFIIELGGTQQNNMLRRITDVTGGLYLDSRDSRQFDNSVQQLSDDLHSEYILSYQSFAGPGPHALSIGVNHSAGQALDTRSFVLPLPLTRIAFSNLQEGETVGDVLKAEISLPSQGETIQRVAFEINGMVVDTDDTKPYELNLDLRPYPTGALTISAVAYGVNNDELAVSTININHAVSTVESTVEVVTPVSPAPVESPARRISPVVIVGIALGAVGMFTIVLLIAMLVNQRQKDRVVEEAEEINNNLFAQVPSLAAVDDVYRTKKVERPAIKNPDTYGTLLVEASDDSTLIGHLFYIISEYTTLGRSTDNDIPFPKDNPVSRQHAEIFLKGERLYLKQIQSTDAVGEAKLPKYGTYVNQRPVSLESIPLKTGDVIMLGKRVRLKFELGEKLIYPEAVTSDDMTTDDDDVDRTRTQS